jgi:hypothetical protein
VTRPRSTEGETRKEGEEAVLSKGKNGSGQSPTNEKCASVKENGVVLMTTR